MPIALTSLFINGSTSSYITCSTLSTLPAEGILAETICARRTADTTPARTCVPPRSTPIIGMSPI